MATDYGIDVSTIPDLDPVFALVSGREALAQAIVRRLQTPRGALPFNPDDGLDVCGWLHEGRTATQLFRLRSAVEAEVLKDERVLSATCETSWAAGSEALTLRVGVEPVVGKAFTLTASVSDFDFALIGVE